MRWCDVIMRGLKKFDRACLDRRDAACERAAGRGFMEDKAAEQNCFLEEDKEEKKDEMKQRREGNGPHFSQSRPYYVALSQAATLLGDLNQAW